MPLDYMDLKPYILTLRERIDYDLRPDEFGFLDLLSRILMISFLSSTKVTWKGTELLTMPLTDFHQMRFV
jgi:hypothetical protein